MEDSGLGRLSVEVVGSFSMWRWTVRADHSGMRAPASASLKHGAAAATLRRLKQLTFTKVEKVGDTCEDFFLRIMLRNV